METMVEKLQRMFGPDWIAEEDNVTKFEIDGLIFKAQISVASRLIIKADPIIDYMVGYTPQQTQTLLKEKKWTIKKIE